MIFQSESPREEDDRTAIIISLEKQAIPILIGYNSTLIIHLYFAYKFDFPHNFILILFSYFHIDCEIFISSTFSLSFESLLNDENGKGRISFLYSLHS
jgi:hypothetical protein